MRAHGERPGARQVRTGFPGHHAQESLADLVLRLLLSSGSTSSWERHLVLWTMMIPTLLHVYSTLAETWESFAQMG
jgi:hypothetical protein